MEVICSSSFSSLFFPQLATSWILKFTLKYTISIFKRSSSWRSDIQIFFFVQSWCRAQTVLWRETVYFLINWHWNLTFLSCVLVAWPSYLVTPLVQRFFHQEFLTVSSGYCEKLLAHSDFSPDVALSQTVVPPGLCSEFLLPLETKVWYMCVSVQDFKNNKTFVIINTVVVNALW